MDASGYIEKLNGHLMNRSLTRLEKGYTFEMVIQNILEDMNIEHEGNSKNPVEWLKSTCTGFDVKIKTLKDEWLTVECKLCLKPVYHCWVERDWLSRTAEIFVTNDPYSISYKDRREIHRQGRKLMSITEFIIFLQKLFKKERTMNGNQYVVLEYLKHLYINVRRRIFRLDYCDSIPNYEEIGQRTLIWFLFRLFSSFEFSRNQVHVGALHGLRASNQGLYLIQEHCSDVVSLSEASGIALPELSSNRQKMSLI